MQHKERNKTFLRRKRKHRNSNNNNNIGPRLTATLNKEQNILKKKKRRKPEIQITKTTCLKKFSKSLLPCLIFLLNDVCITFVCHQSRSRIALLRLALSGHAFHLLAHGRVSPFGTWSRFHLLAQYRVFTFWHMVAFSPFGTISRFHLLAHGRVFTFWQMVTFSIFDTSLV